MAGAKATPWTSWPSRYPNLDSLINYLTLHASISSEILFITPEVPKAICVAWSGIGCVDRQSTISLFVRLLKQSRSACATIFLYCKGSGRGTWQSKMLNVLSQLGKISNHPAKSRNIRIVSYISDRHSSIKPKPYPTRLFYCYHPPTHPVPASFFKPLLKRKAQTLFYWPLAT